jgi:uncharacterized protein YndB with AHSA1/START domain
LKSADCSLLLVVRRKLVATPERLFDAWTRAEELRQWWGPENVKCIAAEVDLRVGGLYRIANEFPDGRVLSISGEFLCIERPHRLEYTWRVGYANAPVERVSVQFVPSGGGQTEVILTHSHVADELTRMRHERGWEGCFAGLEDYLQRILGPSSPKSV